MCCVLVIDSQKDTTAFRLRLLQTKLYKCFYIINDFCKYFGEKNIDSFSKQ